MMYRKSMQAQYSGQNGTFQAKIGYGLDKIKDLLGIYIVFKKNGFYEYKNLNEIIYYLMKNIILNNKKQHFFQQFYNFKYVSQNLR